MENTSSFNLEKVIEDAKSVITNPVNIYRNMPKTGGFTEPVIFVIVLAFIAGAIFLVFSLFGGGLASVGLTALIVLPIAMLIGSFVSAAIMYLIWKLMGSNYNYETAYRCVASSMALAPVMALVSVIPYLGTVVGVLWVMYLMFIASKEVHELDEKKAMITFGILAFFGVIINVSSENAARNMQQNMGKFEEQMGRSMEDINNMSPEEAGKAFGEFMRGMEEGSKAN
ncbi:MAG: YIP1 family protein [Gammaproteobacteria bacterium]